MEKRKKRTGSEIWDITKKILGIIFIIIGIIGLFLPFLQGLLLIIIGLALYNNKKIGRYIAENIEKLRRKINK